MRAAVEIGPVKLRRTYEVAKSPKKGDHSEIYDLLARYSSIWIVNT